MAVNAGAIVVATALRVVYGFRNAQANRLGTPARSLIETKLASRRVGVEEDVHDDVGFRYVY